MSQLNSNSFDYIEEAIHRFISNELWSKLQRADEKGHIVPFCPTPEELRELDHSLCEGVSALLEELRKE